MDKGAVRSDARHDRFMTILREGAIAIVVGAATLYVIAKWPIAIATFIYREI